jgi:actin cytoskeleton-regulatory complex protein SLA1
VVYDISDPDWILVGLNSEYGFAPSNYIQLLGDAVSVAHPAAPVAQQRSPIPQLPQRRAQETEVEEEEEADVDPEVFNSAHSSPVSSTPNPAAAIAGILHKQIPGPPPPPSNPPVEPEEEEVIPVPALPQRPLSQIASPVRQSSPLKPSPEQSSPSNPQHARIASNDGGIHESPPFVRVGNPVPSPRSPSGYHIYNISEMVSVMGKRKKMPTTLGINIATGTIFISPENSGDAGQEEWTADKLTHYSIEGKHIFLDLVRPSRNIDFHAGAKDTAQEIVSALGEIAGVYRAEGLREVIAAGQGGQLQRKGQVLYDFMAQGDDEVTVAVGDEVIVLDNSKSEEWWMVRRLKNGREGVVPSSYVEISGIVSLPSSTTGINAGRSTVEQNRLEEERLAKEAARKSKNANSIDARTSEVGPGVKLPERRSSLVALSDSNNRSRHKRDRSDKESGSSRASMLFLRFPRNHRGRYSMLTISLRA